jgi:DNA polymerase/3'-5' exonuclease PolX
MNQHIIDTLKQLVRYYDTKRKEEPKISFKITSINKALKNINAHDQEITSEKDALAIKGIGKGIAGRIGEILETGTLSELPQEDDGVFEKMNIKGELLGVTGIGPVMADKLIEKEGVTSVKHLMELHDKGNVKLTHQITMGIKYYDDLSERIPRKEIDAIKNIVLSQLYGAVNKDMTIQICGSYRRQLPTSGDIDVLITHKTQTNLLGKVVAHLKSIGFLIDDLTSSCDKKYMGVCRMADGMKARHIDIRYVPHESFCYGLLYFTGSADYNKFMRYEANKKGLKLSEYTMCVKDDPSNLLLVKTEKEIFELLDIEYVKPQDRK